MSLFAAAIIENGFSEPPPRVAPESMELTGKVELMTWVLTWLTSTWYIKNPFLKSKINDVS